ncbi:hypothetical protein ABZ070_14400 [Streptomyces sp. NPDC006283]|uniref:hypothetical protein n=1 Tax=Streptomyces sp. NPDC006283 TaxID=3156741 RepID=UPI0033A5016C
MAIRTRVRAQLSLKFEICFTGHSPRRGLATSSRLKGDDQIVIAKQGGWARTPSCSPDFLKSSTSGRATPP